MRIKVLLMALFCSCVVVRLAAADTQSIRVEQLADHGLPAGTAHEVLPGVGALVHLQLSDALSVLEGVEEILVAGVPDKAVPPDLQELLQTDHPLLTLLGVQTIQQPVTAESFEQLTGLKARGEVSLTLYLGDPRRMFVLSLPSSSREPVAQLMNRLLQPTEVEEILLGDKKALRIASPKLEGVSELFVVTSSDTVYVSGDRSLAIALHDTPTAQRFGQDSFLQRALPADNDQQIRLVVNPAAIKPVAMQLQGLRGLASMLLQQQRANILQGMPQEAREQLEMQFRMQFGVESLDEFADYAECMITATLEQVVDYLTGGMVAFEGLVLTADLQGGMEQFNLKLFSQKYQEKGAVKPIPLAEVKRALAWLGSDYQSFSATGQKPAPTDSPILTAWTKRVQAKLDQKGLKSGVLDRLTQLLKDRQPVPMVESRAPWVLTTYAPLRPLPSLADAETLEDYFIDMELPVYREVKLVPGKGTAFLERCFRRETEILNQNRQLDFEFANTLQKQRPWIDQLNRYQSEAVGGVKKLTRESAWISRGGLFGYDQHELVNRKVVWARQVGDYLVYHRGAKSADWLRELSGSDDQRLAGGVTRLLDRVPEGAGYVSVNRVLVGLPSLVNWVGALESKLHADAEAYVTKAQSVLDAHDDMEKAKQAIRGLRMPEMVGSVAIDTDSRRVYALLPTGQAAFPLPRPRLVPLVQELLSDYAAQADDVGGCLVYSKTEAGSWEFTALQSWDAVTTLTRTFGNALFENYLASWEKREALLKQVGTQRDWDVAVFDDVIARNPQWAFIQQPQPKTDAQPGKPIPPREVTDSKMVDLTEYYNGALNETWQKGGLANNSLAALPGGIQEFDGVTFDVRGVVQLSGREAIQQLRVRFPEAVNEIPVQANAAQVHFLHACGWNVPEGTKVGSYVIRYADGSTQTVPINYGKDVQDWWMNDGVPEGSGLVVAWKGQNQAAPNGPQIGIYKSTWHNPSPDKTIATIDYRSAMTAAAPFLVAITLE